MDIGAAFLRRRSTARGRGDAFLLIPEDERPSQDVYAGSRRAWRSPARATIGDSRRYGFPLARIHATSVRLGAELAKAFAFDAMLVREGATGMARMAAVRHATRRRKYRVTLTRDGGVNDLGSDTARRDVRFR